MSAFLFHVLRFYTRWERWIVSSLVILFAASFAVLFMRFYREQTVRVPRTGGTYIEGSVGELRPLLPWFTVANDVNRDIVSLVYAGLLRWNPQTGRIEDDLASFTLSRDGRVYTFTLKDGVPWHDATADDPHVVTADDVLFTFQTIQDPQFPNSLLRQNFRGVEVTKIDDHTVQFRLEKAYSFFPSNLTLGLLPRRTFEGIPPQNLLQAVDIGLHPIGAGPYRFKSLIQTDLSTEVTLERFPRTADIDSSYIARIVFRIFPSYTTLLSDVGNLDGVRLVPRSAQGEYVVSGRLRTVLYTLPQYVALFLNLDREVLQDPKLRLGLQLGTNKKEIIEVIGEQVVVDTPFLGAESTDWRYRYDPAAAQGALFESEWYFPEKLRLQRLLEEREANVVGVLRVNPLVLLETGALLTLTGSLSPDVRLGYSVNGIPILPHPTASGAWVVRLSTDGGTGSLRLGSNLVRLTDAKGRIRDSFYTWRTTDVRVFRKATEEQRLLATFIASRAGGLPAESRIAATDLFLDEGFLRRRHSTDPAEPRVNRHGKTLALSILTSASPPQYRRIAELIALQWKTLGVEVMVDIPTHRDVFEERLLRRDYDVLLFGQSLLDNLDGYPYWHSHGRQKNVTVRTDLRLDAYNLSQYASFPVDTLLEIIRGHTAEAERTEALRQVREILARDVPAVFLYSPEYAFAYAKSLRGVELGELSLHSDRFHSLPQWYIKERRVFPPGRSFLSFIPWLFGFLPPPVS